MEIILLKDLGTLGDKHDVVSVKSGYGRNYLIPKKLGVIANGANLARLDEIKVKDKAEEDKKIGEFQEILTKVSGKTLKLGVKAGTSGKIFGSITPIQLSQALREQFGLEVPRKKIILDEEIKEIGTYEATLALHDSVKGTVSFELVKE